MNMPSISNMDFFWVVLLVAMSTLFNRSFFWWLGSHIQFHPKVQNALRYAPICALFAIVVPDIVLVNHTLLINHHNPKLIAALVAAGFYYGLNSKNMLVNITVGMLCYTLVRYFVG